MKATGFAVFISMFLSLVAFGNIAQAANTYSLSLSSASTQYASLSNPVGLPTGSSARTIEAWIKTSDTSQQFFFDMGADNSSFGQFALSVAPFDGNKIGVQLSGGNVFYDAIGVTDGNWHHLAFSYPAGLGIASGMAYMDGVALSQVSSNDQTPNTTSDRVTIGATVNGSASFDGKIDDVRVWNSARTQSEIQSDMTSELTGSESGLVGYWNFNNSYSDLTSNGNNLTAVNSPMFSSDVPFPGTPAPAISSFTATPSNIMAGQSTTLAWSVSGATTLSINQGIGIVTGTSVSVSPNVTTTYTLTASNQGLATSSSQVVVTVDPLIGAVRKPNDQSIASNTTLQNDSDLSLTLLGNKTYIVEGVVFASTSSVSPDLKIAFTAPIGSSLSVGFLGAAGTVANGGELEALGVSSGRITLVKNKSMPIIIRGTVTTNATGNLRLQWAQFVSNPTPVVIGKGSYLKLIEI